LALTESQLEEIKIAYENALSKNRAKQIIVGFNRRFSPALKEVKKILVSEQAKSINIRVNAGEIATDHWINDPEIGGGRIIGEACHFIDLAMYIAGAPIKTISAEALDKANGIINSVSISMSFENGSIASISYFSNGNKLVPKEQIEIFCGANIIQIDDFKSMQIIGKSRKKITFKTQDKGHQNEFKLFRDSIINGTEPIIPFEEIYLSSLATFKVLESIRENRKIIL